jgi:hypothetical protein
MIERACIMEQDDLTTIQVTVKTRDEAADLARRLAYVRKRNTSQGEAVRIAVERYLTDFQKLEKEVA